MTADRLSFHELRKASVLRCEESFHPVESWSPTDWACALAGEVGEACNLIKKLRRGDVVGAENRAQHIHAIADELADVVAYLDLLAARLDINLGEAVARKFNAVSERIGSAVRLEPVPVDGDAWAAVAAIESNCDLVDEQGFDDDGIIAEIRDQLPAIRAALRGSAEEGNR